MPSVHKIHKRKLYITCSLTCCCLLEFFIYSADSTYKERPVLIPQNKLSCYLEQKEESIVELDSFFKKILCSKTMSGTSKSSWGFHPPPPGHPESKTFLKL